MSKENVRIADFAKEVGKMSKEHINVLAETIEKNDHLSPVVKLLHDLSFEDLCTVEKIIACLKEKF